MTHRHSSRPRAAVACLALALSTSAQITPSVLDVTAGPSGSNPTELTAVGSTVFFTVNNGGALMRHRSSQSAKQVAQVAGISNARELTAFNDALFLAAGTSLVRVDTGGAVTPIASNLGQAGAQQLVTTADRLFFTGTSSGRRVLWSSDGTASGTGVVQAASQMKDPGLLTPSGKHVYFTLKGAGSRKLMVTDGTNVIQLTTNGAPDWLTDVDGRLFFSLDLSSFGGRELWVSDGTASGTKLVRNINQGNNGNRPRDDSTPRHLLGVGNVCYFSARQGPDTELWRSDGTTAGTKRVANINPNGSSSPAELVLADDRVFFVANNGTDGRELWSMDTVTETVSMVKNIDIQGDAFPGAGSSSLAAIGSGRLIACGATSGSIGRELWVTDGTGSGTGLLADIDATINQGSRPEQFTTAGTRVYFIADDGGNPSVGAATGKEVRYVELDDIRVGPAVWFSFGRGCRTSNGDRPRLTGVELPRSGTVFGVRLTRARPNALVCFVCGPKRDNFVVTPQCTSFLGQSVSPNVFFTPILTDASGSATLKLDFTANGFTPPPLSRAYFQVAGFDPNGGDLGGVGYLSAGLGVIVGS